ncbi:MAG: hypothetical protein QM711_12755 [Micropruina sp.]|uniref:hypothetical protein n=1 Tax=Micropruina sp. TaxID=2737536 RepID=UPI0039E71F9B
MTHDLPRQNVIDACSASTNPRPFSLLREKREKLKHLTQTSYEAALEPADATQFFLCAARRACSAHGAFVERRRTRRPLQGAARRGRGNAPTYEAIADPAFKGGDDARLAAILNHVDLVTLTPKRRDARKNRKALRAGLDDRDIVTLAGLIAFVNYQVLVVAGLKMMRDN